MDREGVVGLEFGWVQQGDQEATPCRHMERVGRGSAKHRADGVDNDVHATVDAPFLSIAQKLGDGL